MSSPGARQRRRRQQYQSPRTRGELALAVGIGAGIVAGTALMIWLLRPGGLADRQPRSSWLVAVALLAALLVVYVVLRPSSKFKGDRRLLLAGPIAGVAVVAVVAGIFWPGGLLRHPLKPIKIPTTPTTPLTSPTTLAGSSTTAPGSSTTAAGSTTTAKSSGASTTVPAGATTTAAHSTSPTTKASSSTTVKPPPVNPSP